MDASRAGTHGAAMCPGSQVSKTSELFKLSEGKQKGASWGNTHTTAAASEGLLLLWEGASTLSLHLPLRSSCAQ